MTTTLLHVPLKAGAKPELFQYTFRDFEGTAMDLTGYAVKVTWSRYSDGTNGEFDGLMPDPDAGETIFDLPEALAATPDMIGLTVWAGDGTRRLEGQTWIVTVTEANGTAPNI